MKIRISGLLDGKMDGFKGVWRYYIIADYWMGGWVGGFMDKWRYNRLLDG